MRQPLLALVLLPGLIAAQETSAVRGRVITRDARPVSNSLVELTERGDSVRTDSSGTFVFTRVSTGRYTLRARAIGYAPQATGIVVSRDSGWTGTITLDPIPQVLGEVAVKSRRTPEFANTDRYDDFFRRRHLGQGTFRTREDIQRLGANNVASVLQGIPGVTATMTIDIDANPIVRLRIARCPKDSVNLAIYLNGTKLMYERSEAGLAEVFNSINVSAIEFVEFYRSPAQIPSDLDRSNNCAALVIWTR